MTLCERSEPGTYTGKMDGPVAALSDWNAPPESFASEADLRAANRRAIFWGALPVYAWMTLLAVTNQPGDWISTSWPLTLVQTVVDSALYCAWLYMFLRLVCRQQLADLNLRPPSMLGDIGEGLLLWLTKIVVGIYVFDVVAILAPETPLALLEMIETENSGPGMRMTMIIYDWLSAALVEELLRAFFISRMLLAYPGRFSKLFAVVVSALLFGAYHLYYGPVDAAGHAAIGLLIGGYYVWRGRLLPLIIAHGLYNNWQSLMSAD
jgi:membrane protease YdiL (CAAX protease family)